MHGHGKALDIWNVHILDIQELQVGFWVQALGLPAALPVARAFPIRERFTSASSSKAPRRRRSTNLRKLSVRRSRVGIWIAGYGLRPRIQSGAGSDLTYENFRRP